MTRELALPYEEGSLSLIEIGDEVIISGELYVGRDRVHERLCRMINDGVEMPFEFKGSAIYYMGPSPAPEGMAIGSAGPTTSARMDLFSPVLIENGLSVMIGKGPRSEKVRAAIERFGGLYLQAYGGCGALYSSKIDGARTILWEDLGPEALLRIKVHDFPAICVIDTRGNVLK